jgi:GNAT superfamily N-acetyltransferase
MTDASGDDQPLGSDRTDEIVTLADGGRVRIRPLLPADRDELARGYVALSPEARRLRFFSAPDHLSPRLLDYLMAVDQRDRAALVAFVIDDDGDHGEHHEHGVGIARYVRDRDDPTCAEVAVTVLDPYQQRGIGTTLLRRLAEVARHNGIRTATASVMWENRELLDGLRALGAEITRGEPGVASVRISMSDPDEEQPVTELRHALRVFASRIGEHIGLRFSP